MSRVRVALADDEVLLRDGLAGLLERSGFNVVGQCGDGAELIDVEHAMDLLATGQSGGYLLKSRVTDVDEFTDTLERLVKGGPGVDPTLVQHESAQRHRLLQVAGSDELGAYRCGAWKLPVQTQTRRWWILDECTVSHE